MRVKIDEHLMYLCIWDFSQKKLILRWSGEEGVEKKMVLCFSILFVKDFSYLKNEGEFKSPKF